MFKVTLISSAILALTAGAAVAQESQKLERIQVTGSSIKRVESETALPVTVISRDAIEKSGAVNVEDILRRLSVNSGQLSDSTQGAGYATSNANLRGRAAAAGPGVHPRSAGLRAPAGSSGCVAKRQRLGNSL